MSSADTEPLIHKLGNYLHQGLKKGKKKLEVLFLSFMPLWPQRMSLFMLYNNFIHEHAT